jgi:hypothetical protein
MQKPYVRTDRCPTAIRTTSNGVALSPPPRTARLFRNGTNQAVRLPQEFELDADDVIIRRGGDSLVNYGDASPFTLGGGCRLR